MKKIRIKKTLPKPLYLNANILLNEMVKEVQSKKKLKPSSLQQLYQLEYNLLISSITKAEAIKNLMLRKSISENKSREIYENIKKKYEFKEIYSMDKLIVLNNYLIECIIKTNLDFKDLIHISLCKKLDIPIVTHDKQMLKNHFDKREFYEKVYKPEELLI